MQIPIKGFPNLFFYAILAYAFGKKEWGISKYGFFHYG